jgi:DNA-binding response OmpR family regulator
MPSFPTDMAMVWRNFSCFPVVREEGSAEIKATARALNTMGASLKKAMDSKIRLVAAAGHDLRTPMTRMRLRAEFLSEEERAQWLHDLDEMDRIADSAILNEAGLPLDLTSAEFDLLMVLVRRPGRLLSRDQIIELTNRGTEEVFDRSIDVLMSRLRKKIGDNEESQMIKTVRNGGYLFSAKVETVGVSS